MPIVKQTNLIKAVNRVNDLPRELPVLPSEVAERFPQLIDWQEQFTKWWYDSRTILQDGTISDLLDATAADLKAYKVTTDASLTTVNTTLATLAAQITALQTELSDLGISDLSDELAALTITVINLQVDFNNLYSQVQNIQVQINNIGANSHHFVTNVAINPWIINHPLGRDPVVAAKVLDATLGTLTESGCVVEYSIPDLQVKIHWAGAESGQAELA